MLVETRLGLVIHTVRRWDSACSDICTSAPLLRIMYIYIYIYTPHVPIGSSLAVVKDTHRSHSSQPVREKPVKEQAAAAAVAGRLRAASAAMELPVAYHPARRPG